MLIMADFITIFSYINNYFISAKEVILTEIMIIYLRTLFKIMNRNTYTSDYSVPSLSLASSRSKKNVPTKDTTDLVRPVEVKSRA